MALSKRQGRFVTNYGLAGTGLACVLTILTLSSISGVLETALQSFAIAIPASAGAGLIAELDEDLNSTVAIKILPVIYYAFLAVGLFGNLHGIHLVFQYMSAPASTSLISSAGMVILAISILNLIDHRSHN